MSMSVSPVAPGSSRRDGRPALRLPALLLLAGLLPACTESTVEVGRELDLRLTGPSSSPLADSVVLEYEAVGRSLLGMIVQYGDGEADTVTFAGSQSAGGRLAHKYSDPGDYLIIGRVQDGLEGSKISELSVTITP